MAHNRAAFVNERGVTRIITAADYPNRRVALKFWNPTPVDYYDAGGKTRWCLLVSRAKGWQGNEAATVATQRVPLPLRLQQLIERVKRANAKRGRAVAEAVAA